MVKTFNCPTCGAPLDYLGGEDLAIPCPFCQSTVVVPAELRSPRSSAPQVSEEPFLEQIRALLMRQQKIEAVKLVRARYDIGLKEALDVVEKVEAGGPLVIPEQRVVPTIPVLDEKEIVTQIRQLLADGNKIGAIKLYRQQYPVGLKEAKDTVEKIERGMLVNLPSKQSVVQQMVTRVAQLEAEKSRPRPMRGALQQRSSPIIPGGGIEKPRSVGCILGVVFVILLIVGFILLMILTFLSLGNM